MRYSSLIDSSETGTWIEQANYGSDSDSSGSIPADLDFLSHLTKEEVVDQLTHTSPLLTASEKNFLRRWQTDLPPGKWGEFLVSWARALEACGSSADLVDSVEYRPVEFNFGGQSFPFVIRSGGNYMQRHKLMKQQKPYFPKAPAGSYDFRLEPESCLLCQNIAEAADSKNFFGVKNNLVLDLGQYAVLPNRYPAQPGASLFLSKHHDDQSSRSSHSEKKTGVPRRCPVEAGKTRNRILPAVDLYWLMCISNSLDLVASRNHVLSGMSIPFHDHFHLFPADLPSTFYFKKILASCRQASPFKEVFELKETPFSLLTVRSSNIRRLAVLAANIIEKLELDHQVYGLVYYQNHIFITPKFKDKVQDYNIPMGGGTVLLFENDANLPNYINLVNKYIPLKGQFDWSPFV